MLTRSEFTLLRGQLAVALTQGDPKNRIRTYFGPDATALLKEIPANLSSYDEYANEVIIYCLKSRWATDPSLMETLLVQLLTAGLSEGTVRLNAVLDRVKQRVDPNDDCYDALWVLRDQPFLNRRTLRPLLKGFLQSDDRSLLRINGQGAGRTYTKELLDYLASKIEGLHFVPIELKAKGAPSYRVQTLAAEMLNPMGEDVPTSSSSSDAAELSRVFLRTIKNQPGVWLFVLDGFSQKDIHPDVRDFIEILAAKCITPEYRRKMRLILVNFAGEFEGILPAAIADDDIPLPSVTRSDLVDCLLQLNVVRAMKGLVPLDGVSTIADAMLAAAPLETEGSEGEDAARARDKALLRFLYDRLRKVAEMQGGQNG